MSPADIEAIERATLAAVAPEALEEIPGWLLPFDSGTVGRAKSAVPTAHTAPDAALLREIEARYAARGLPALLRIPATPQFDALRDLLARSGYAGERPTEVHTAAVAAPERCWDGPAAVVADAPDAGWSSVFLGEGFDPADGASRVRSLSRASGSLFCSVREHDRTVAAGAAAFGHGWASVHGMRTAQAARGRGHATRVLATLPARRAPAASRACSCRSRRTTHRRCRCTAARVSSSRGRTRTGAASRCVGHSGATLQTGGRPCRMFPVLLEREHACRPSHRTH